MKHRLIDIGICKLFGQAMMDGSVHAVTTADALISLDQNAARRITSSSQTSKNV